MAFLEIGINNGWKLGPNTEVTDKGGIKVHFVKGKAITSALAMMEADDEDIPDESTVFVFPPDITNKKGERKDALTVGKIFRSKHLLFKKIFKLYFTEEELKKDFPVTDIYKKFDITEENQETMFTTDSVVKEMFKQLGNMVIAFVKKHDLPNKEAFRIKLKRQSDKKAFADLTPFPDRDNWIELMSIPEDISKVKFSKWERDQRWDNTTIPTDTIVEETSSDSTGDDVPEFDDKASDDLPFD